MAEEEKKSNPWEPVLLLIAFLLICLALIWARGGLAELNSGGFFTNPIAPPQVEPANPPATPTSDNSVT